MSKNDVKEKSEGKKDSKIAGIFKKAAGSMAKAMDQDGDGKFDLRDVGVGAKKVAGAAQKAAGGVADATKKAAEGAAAAVKEGSAQIARSIEEQKLANELEKLRPVFLCDLADEEFICPNIIRIAEEDSKHRASSQCKGSIGHLEERGGVDVLFLYPTDLNSLALSFEPENDEGLYYRDPYEHGNYLSVDSYFDRIRDGQIHELQRVAQDLGAKHFKITVSEMKKSVMAVGVKGKAGIKPPKVFGKKNASVDVSVSNKSNEYSDIRIAAEMNFGGAEPKKPALKYYKHDENVNNLISMRLHDNDLVNYKFDLECGKGSGIKHDDAVKVDAAISAMKLNGNVSFTSVLEEEMRRVLRYEIEF